MRVPGPAASGVTLGWLPPGPLPQLGLALLLLASFHMAEPTFPSLLHNPSASSFLCSFRPSLDFEIKQVLLDTDEFAPASEWAEEGRWPWC